MKFALLHVYTLLSLVLVGSHAVSPQVYWMSVLPNTPMPKAIKDLSYTQAWDQDGKEKVTSNTASMYIKQKLQPEQYYSYVASKDEVKDHSQNQLSHLPPIINGVSKDEAKDHSQNRLSQLPPIINGASKDEVKDHPQNILIYNGVSKDEAEDHSQNPLSQLPPIINGADEVKDHPQNILIYKGASKDEAQDHSQNPRPQLPPIINGASKDEIKDHPQNLLFYYGASKDEAEDHSQNPRSQLSPINNGVSKTDDPQNILIYNGASKDEAEDHSHNRRSQLSPLYNGASKDEVKDHPQNILIYNSASKEDVKENPFAQLLFLENDLHQGKEMKLQFKIKKNFQKTPFQPKDISDSIPFSSKDLPEIYTKFSVKPDSMEAKIIKQSLIPCEHKSIEGEEKLCATSLESMIDFVITKLGKNVKSLSTEVYAKDSILSQKYKIRLFKKLAANKVVVCHRQDYPYAVFYCHISAGTQSYVVSMEGEDGTKVKSMAVCHTDTSKWNPKHMAFQLLKVAPGTVPVCHFLLEDDVLWVP